MIGLLGNPARLNRRFIDPTSIGGMVAWYTSLTGVTGSLGGAVDAWADQSSQGNNLTGTSPNRPIYSANIFGGNKHAITFPNAETDWLIRTAVTCNSGYSAFVTFKTPSTDTTSTESGINPPQTFVGNTNATSATWNNFGLNGGNVSYCYYASTEYSGWHEYTSTGQSMNSGTLHTIGVTHATGGTLKLYADGVEVLNSTANPYDTTYTGFDVLGVGYNYSDQAKDLDMAECMVWNAAISADNMSDLHYRAMALWI